MVQRFIDLLAAADTAPAGMSVPSRLAAAAGAALTADGTVISLLSQPSMQMPIGFSGTRAAEAEQLQFSIGDGPALDAHRLGLPLLANADTLEVCWQLFHSQLEERTAFRAVASIPLRHGPARVGVLDLYFHHPRDPATFPIGSAERIGELVVERLLADRYVTDFDELGPAWLINHASQPRGQVSVAMGMVCLALRVTAETALDLIRLHAEAADSTVDAVSAQLTDGTLHPRRLTSSVSADNRRQS